MRLLLVCVLTSVAVLAAGVGGAVGAQRQEPPGQWLAFAHADYHGSSCFHKNNSIARGVPGTNHLQTIVADLGMVIRMSFSPTGDHLVFDAANDTTTVVPAINATGSAAMCYHQLYMHSLEDNTTRPLDVGLVDARAPAWSPDGQWIAFVGEERVRYTLLNGQTAWVDEHYVYIVRPDGLDLQLLDFTVQHGRVSWSPDSQFLVYPRTVDGVNHQEIFRRNIYDGLPERLTFNDNIDLSPVYDPTGEKIAFLSDRGAQTGYYDVFIMNANGSLPQQVEFTVDPSWALTFSADGQDIYFVSQRRFGGRYEIVQTPTAYTAPGVRRQPSGYFRTETVQREVLNEDGTTSIETYQQTYAVTPPPPVPVTPDDNGSYWAPTLAPPFELPWNSTGIWVVAGVAAMGALTVSVWPRRKS